MKAVMWRPKCPIMTMIVTHPKSFFIFCSSLHAVLHAMREDSEKVPSLLTDYILKGTPSLPVSKLLLPFKTPHITTQGVHSQRYSITLRKHCSHSKQSFCLDWQSHYDLVPEKDAAGHKGPVRTHVIRRVYFQCVLCSLKACRVFRSLSSWPLPSLFLASAALLCR